MERLKDRLPEERKYVIDNHQVNSMIVAPFGVITAFPDDPKLPLDDYSSTISSSINSFTTKETHTDISRNWPSRKTVNATNQTETEERTDTSESNLTAALWKTEFSVAEFEQQNRSLNIELINLKNSLWSANMSWAMAKENANRAESKLEISEKNFRPFRWD